MGVSSSLYASISGLSTMGNAMSVLGDNVSNVNTIAFKSSRATFQDVLSQSVATAAGAAQVGRGVTMTTIDGVFAQGSFESTSTATDLAIGGQGFFMLRASGSAEADMYTRAGEFRFDKEGFLVNPTGNFVQGWTLDTTSGERQGTIGDINLGKTTPPVQTTSVQVIANVDSRKNNETTELNLFDAWNGTNPALPVPTSPISSNSYEYTTAIKVYDSVGASHDLTVYFDRTGKDNQWEFLVTCEPSEDQRVLSTGLDATGIPDGSNDVALIYTPSTSYDYQLHKGAGALLYGKINFSTSGAISNMSAWNVPPDGVVDPAQSTNLLTLGNTDQYYSFATNFTGATTNQLIELNLGARFSGASTDVPQALVSDSGALASGTSTPITKETLWSAVTDSSGAFVDTATPATVLFSGYNNDGAAVAGSYALVAGGKVQDLLTALDNTFNCTSTIDAAGRIKMTDTVGGSSGMAVTSFLFSSGVNPFGSGTSVANAIARSGGPLVASDGTTPITSTATLLTSVYDSGTDKLDNGDVFTFAGTRVSGAAAALVFTVGSSGTTVQSLLTALENAYGVNPGDVTATLDGTGHILLIDNTAGGLMAPSLTSTTQHTAATPFGVAGALVAPFSSGAMTDISTGSFAIGTSSLTNVFVGGNAIAQGDVIRFTVGTDANTGTPGTTVNFTVGGAGMTTVQNLMDWMDDVFSDGAVGGANTLSTTVISAGGVITTTDTTGVNDLAVTLAYVPNAAVSTPLGAPGAFTLSTVTIGGQINIATAKQQVISTARAETTATGGTPITGSTLLTNVFDDPAAGLGTALAVGDVLTFDGFRGVDGLPVAAATFVVGTDYGEPLTGAGGTVQDLLSWLEGMFQAEASIDGAGRLVLTDWKADATGGYGSLLEITSIGYSGGGSEPFGTGTFATIAADLSGEDGSLAGGTQSINFSTEALSTTQYANSSTTIFQDQNGFAAGFLQSVSVDTGGIITGNYSNGQVLERAQVALASFNNLAGMRKEGGNIFRETTASGAPITGPPGTNGLGTISPNSLEQSNVDLGAEFVKLITTQRGFQANSKIITTTDEMLADLINIKR